MGEYIGTDVYGREMYLSHSCNMVYCQHIKDGKVVKESSMEVDNYILRMFAARHISGAYIYDEIHRRYHRKL